MQQSNKKSQSNLGRAASPPLTAQNNYTTKSPLVIMGCPTFTPETAPSLRRSPPYLIGLHPSFDRPTHHLNQPFCHSTPSGQTDRPTDELGDRSVPRPAPHMLYILTTATPLIMSLAYTARSLFGVDRR